MQTLLSLAGLKRGNRGGEVELAYASFLSSDSATTSIRQQSALKFRVAEGSLYDKWSDRRVTLRGNFVCVGKMNKEAKSRVYQISSVLNLFDCHFTIICSNLEKLHFRAGSEHEKGVWVTKIREELDLFQSLQCIDDSNLAPSSEEHTLLSKGSSTQNDASDDGPSLAADLDLLSPLERKHPRNSRAAVSAPHSPSCISQQASECGRNTSPRKSARRLTKSAGRSVGVFWDTTTVQTPLPNAQEAATGKLQDYAKKHGNVEVFKIYGDEDESCSEKDLRKRMDRDMLMWLRDQSQHFGEVVALVILISDRAFLETTKKMAQRGMGVIVINSRVDKSVAVSQTAFVEYKRASTNLWETRHEANVTELTRTNSEHKDSRSGLVNLHRTLFSGFEDPKTPLLVLANLTLAFLVLWST